jgi:uncharacterized RDD family membrane protein YckC
VKRQAWHDKIAGTVVVRADALELDRGRWLRRLRRWLRYEQHIPAGRLPFPKHPSR